MIFKLNKSHGIKLKIKWDMWQKTENSIKI